MGLWAYSVFSTNSNACLTVESSGANGLIYIGQISCGDKEKNLTPDNFMNSAGGMDVDKYLDDIKSDVEAIPSREQLTGKIESVVGVKKQADGG